MKLIKPSNIIYFIIILVILAYFALKAFTTGNDINVYLHAAKQIFNGENIYKDNPYNNYLYSPLFALLLQPIAHINMAFARFIWLLVNAFFAYRLWVLITNFLKHYLSENKKTKRWLLIGVIILSFGFLNHNLVLGQVTILILWLTLEGIYQILIKKNIYGAALIALGINIKIIPVIAIGYLFLKRKFLAIGLIIIFLVISLALPIPFIGYEYNKELLISWENTINPDTEKYVFEDNNGCQSLNCLLPAYFTVTEYHSQQYGLKRMIATVSYENLKIILLSLRLLLLLSVVLIIFIKFKKRNNKKLWWLWEISYLLLVSLLFFPHQMKYTMLYFVPTGAYLIFYFLIKVNKKEKVSFKDKIIAVFSFLIMLVLSVSGRDLIGDYIVNILDFYHFMGLSNILFLIILLLCPPTTIDFKIQNKISET